jgi:plastocyanin
MIVFGLVGQVHADAQQFDVSLHAEVTRKQGATQLPLISSAGVVVWLTPLQRTGSTQTPEGRRYELVQKDKQFAPHLLVVPTGSSVVFPNLDPFYHNVFSLFNGKRFDLGLYEAHTQRSVHFDRDGVSYIFCNIHPGMGAVIVSLSTPYYGISAPDGNIAIHAVPAGSYQLNVWAEDVSTERLNALSQMVNVSSGNTHLGPLIMETSGDLMNHHLNKFGEGYNPVPKDPY